MKRKKKRLKLKFDFVTLLVIVLAFVILIGGTTLKSPKKNLSSKKLVIDEVIEDDDEKEDTTSKIKVDDKIVKDLYGRVTSEDGEYKYWMYTDYNTITDLTADINISTASEIIKMNFVGNSVDQTKAEKVECPSDNTIPEIIANARSVCSYNKRFKGNQEQIGYKKSYIESIYKNIFGGTFNPSKDVPLYLTQNSGEIYFYVEGLDMYLKYYGEPSKVVSAGNYSGKVSNVTEKDNKLKLLEDVTSGDNKIKFRYTFEKQDSGNYIFISREKED